MTTISATKTTVTLTAPGKTTMKREKPFEKAFFLFFLVGFAAIAAATIAIAVHCVFVLFLLVFLFIVYVFVVCLL